MVTNANTTLSEQLERLVDSSDLETVLGLLAEICDEKATHIATNWVGTNERAQVKAWERAAVVLEQAEMRVGRLGL